MQRDTKNDGWRSRKSLARALALCVIASMTMLAHAQAASPEQWVTSWNASSQQPMPGTRDHYQAQTLRLIAHVSVGGSQARIRLSNRYGDTPLTIGAAHLALRTHGADIDAATDRALTFSGRASVVIAPHATILSDTLSINLPALSDVAVSVYLPDQTVANTVHVLGMQTSYVSRSGNRSAVAHFPTERRIDTWPILASLDVLAAPTTYAAVVFGDSMVDGDGSTGDANQRWPDDLAMVLHERGRSIAVVNAGLIGNRLLHDSPGGPFGAALGEAGLKRFSRDALDRIGAKIIIVSIGRNDLGFLQALGPKTETVNADQLIAGYQQLIDMAHQHGMRIVGTTLAPFEGVTVIPGYFSPAKETMRQQVNAWIRNSGRFDAVLDIDQIVRDPTHPSRLSPALDSGDHLHPNDTGYRAMAAALPLATFDRLVPQAGHG